MNILEVNIDRENEYNLNIINVIGSMVYPTKPVIIPKLRRRSIDISLERYGVSHYILDVIEDMRDVLKESEEDIDILTPLVKSLRNKYNYLRVYSGINRNFDILIKII